MMWRGATDWPEFLTGSSMIIAGGTAAKLVIYPIAQGAAPGTRLTNWAICILTGEPGTPPPVRQGWSRRVDPAAVEPHVARFRVPYVDHAVEKDRTGISPLVLGVALSCQGCHVGSVIGGRWGP